MAQVAASQPVHQVLLQHATKLYTNWEATLVVHVVDPTIAQYHCVVSQISATMLSTARCSSKLHDAR